jgi:hypothetical protein
MVHFCALVLAELAFFLAVGLPVALLLTKADPDPRESVGWVMIAPSLGATMILALAANLHSLGLHAILWPVSIVAVLFLVLIARSSPTSLLRRLIFVLLVAGLCVAFNSSDLSFAGLDYFPLTNDDTFTYLGLIDQIREVGWVKPTIRYPAGFEPWIAAAVDIRVPGTVLTAEVANAFRLETHTAFFVNQRAFLPTTILAATGTVLMTSRSVWAASLCFAALTLGNTLMNQMLQQFNSSSMGTIVGSSVLALLIWATRAARTSGQKLMGYGAVGFALGTMAITSMEAHPFYVGLTALAIVFVAFRRAQLIELPKFLCGGLIGYLLPSLILLARIWPQILYQYLAAPAMPGGGLLRSGFIVFLSGVSVRFPPSLWSQPIIGLVSAGTMAVSCAASIYLLWRGAFDKGPRIEQSSSDALVLGTFGIGFLFFLIILAVAQVGYGLLKMADYFAFLNAITVSVATAMLAKQLPVTWRAATILYVAFCLVAYNQKIFLLSIYRSETKRGRLPAEYRGPSSLTAAELAQLSMEQLNLYLYENRMNPQRVAIPPGRTVRFIPTPPD